MLAVEQRGYAVQKGGRCYPGVLEVRIERPERGAISKGIPRRCRHSYGKWKLASDHRPAVLACIQAYTICGEDPAGA